MLTRLVRTQLILFAIASVIGMTVMVVTYLQAPTLLGIGRMTVTLQLPGTGGLYRFSNVTYRGVQIGKVTDVRPTRDGAEATLSLATSPKIPADLHAAVQRSFPAGRWGTPEDAANLVAWLVGDDAAWITGQVIDSEGGFRH